MSIYKDSGVEWIGEIPKHWSITKLKNQCQIIPSNVDKKSHDDETEVKLCNYIDVYYNEFIDDSIEYMMATANEHELKKFQLLEGDVLITKDSEDPHDIAVPALVVKTQPKLLCGYHLSMIRSYNRNCNGSYLFWVLRDASIISQLHREATGITRWAIANRHVKNSVIPLPSETEQKAIAAYLSKTCAAIDKTIEAKQKQIEILDALRKSIIHKAVTCGLDDSVELKDTGMEWLGKTPKHWKVRRIKSIADIRYGLGQPPAQKDDGVPMVRATNVSAGKITDMDLIYIDPIELPPGRNPYLKEGEIIVVRSGAYTGDSAIIPKRYAGAVAGYDMVITATQAEPRFLAYSLLSDYVLNSQILLLTLRAAQPHLNAHELGGVRLSVPETRTEQREICDYLDLKLAELARITATIDAQISTLEQYRKSLIHECVTGKRRITDDVRDQL